MSPSQVTQKLFGTRFQNEMFYLYEMTFENKTLKNMFIPGI